MSVLFCLFVMFCFTVTYFELKYIFFVQIYLQRAWIFKIFVCFWIPQTFELETLVIWFQVFLLLTLLQVLCRKHVIGCSLVYVFFVFFSFWKSLESIFDIDARRRWQCSLPPLLGKYLNKREFFFQNNPFLSFLTP